MNRTTFLVDGLNLYHSLRAASGDLGGASTEWLDIRSLLSSFLHVVGGGAQLEKIYYFSALAYHVDTYKPGSTARHRMYIDCLRATGIVPVLGRFKYKEVYCLSCKKDNPHHEEKETDVAISMKLVEIFFNDEADTVFLVTGDTDLAPGVRTASQMFPTKEIGFIFPYKRKNKELAALVSKHFHMKKERYAKHQLPDPMVLPSGRKVSKPSAW